MPTSAQASGLPDAPGTAPASLAGGFTELENIVSGLEDGELALAL